MEAGDPPFDPPDFLVVLTTAPSAEVAESLANTLVDRRLAACVNVLPEMRSIYRWEGAVERGREWLLLIKTRADAFEALAAAIRELHPYEVPEILALPVERGSRAYLDWLAQSVEPPGG